MKPPRDDPRRVESPARMTVAEAVPTPQEPVMRVAEAVTVRVTELATLSGGVLVGSELAMSPDQQIGRTAPDPLPLPPQPPPLPQDPARPWRPINTAPQDGTLLEGRAADGSEFHMIWRRTSRHNGFRWVPVEFWSSHLSRERLKVEPVQFRLPEGFAAPGSVVA